MPDKLPPRITDLLLAWSGGDCDALAELVPLVNDELRQMARQFMEREKQGHILQPTALVHEFFLRVQGRRTVSWKDRRHYFGFAGQTMRRILVEHARRRDRLKHGSGEVPLSLGPELEEIPGQEVNLDVVAVHEALGRLAEIDPRAAEVVELRFFVGMTVQETAAVLGRSVATVKRDWEFARLWLYRRLKEPGDRSATELAVEDSVKV